MPEVLSLSNNVPLFLASMLVKILAVFVVVILIVAYATWVERKVIGHMQTRLGPMQTGWHGLLQPIADGLKLFFKEDIIPTEATKVPFVLAPMMILVPAFITIAVVPFGPDVTLVITSYSIHYTKLYDSPPDNPGESSNSGGIRGGSPGNEHPPRR